MSTIKFACPACGQHLSCEDNAQGMQIQCPACSQAVIVPHSLRDAPLPQTPQIAAPTPLPPSQAMQTPQGVKNMFIAYYLGVLRKYAVFAGRARRKEYWFFVLFSTLISLPLTFVDVAVGVYSREFGIGVLSGLYALVIFVPAAAVTVRKLQDTNHNGWWIVVPVIPLIYLARVSQF